MSAARERLAGWATAALLVATGWTLMAVWVAPSVTPTILEVAQRLWADLDFYGPHILTTVQEAAWGWLWGNLAAIIIGSLIVLSRLLAPFLERLAVAVYAVPLLAIGPILQIVTTSATTKIVLAALAVFFTTTVTWVLGLRSTDRAMLDVVHAAGGGALSGFTRVRVRAALPLLFAGLQIAAPAAVLGAIIGEYLGGTRGLGVAMIQSQSSFAVDRTWALAIVISALVGLAYGITGLIGRLLLPWAGKESPIPIMQLGSHRISGMWPRLGVGLGTALAIIALWWALLDVFALHPYFAYRPPDVWQFLIDPGRAAERADLWDASLRTLLHTGVGFSVGLVASVAMAVAVVLSPVIDRVVTPVSIALRSIPIIAMTPLIVLVFGRNLGAVVVIVGLVTFFPTLVAMTTAMRNAPAAACELVAAYGGSALRQLRTVRLPSAVPALFASIRIAIPGAVGGALLAEWLATGQGLGSLMLRATASPRFGVVWTAAVIVVAASVAGYLLVGAIESRVDRRMTHGSTLSTARVRVPAIGRSASLPS